MQTAEPFIPELSSFEVEITTEKLKDKFKHSTMSVWGWMYNAMHS